PPRSAAFLFSVGDTPHFSTSFPTRRSSDLVLSAPAATCQPSTVAECGYTTTFDCIVQNGSRRPAETTMAALYLPSTLWSEYLARSEEHTSELQSRENLVCRLLLEKKRSR